MMGDDQLEGYRTRARQRYTASSSSSSLSASLDTDEVLARLLAQEQAAENRESRRGGRGGGRVRWGGRGRGGRGRSSPQAAYMPADLLVTDMRRSGPPSFPSFDMYLQQAAYENELLNQAYLNSIMSNRQHPGIGYDGMASAYSNDRNLMSLMSRELTDADYNTLLNLEDVKNSRGASEIDISRLPTFVFQKKDGKTSNYREDPHDIDKSLDGRDRNHEISRKKRKMSNDDPHHVTGKEGGEDVIVISSDDESDNGHKTNMSIDLSRNKEVQECVGHKDGNGVIVILDDSPQPRKNDNSLFASSSTKPLSLDLEDASRRGADDKDKDSSNIDKEKSENCYCCICMEYYQTGDHMVTLPCLHVFHRDCIIPWLKNCATCPIDKSEILARA